jgi:sugar phosphate permease
MAATGTSRTPLVPETMKPSRIRIAIMAILFITVLVAFFDRVNVTIIIADPAFKSEMHIMNSPTAQGLLMSFFIFTYALGQIFLGPIGDWLGPRKTVCVAVFSWGITQIIGGFARVLNTLYLSRLLLGAVEGMHYPMMSRYVRSWMPPREWGKANAAWTMGVYVGPAISMPLFAWLVSRWGWRSSYCFCAVIGFCILPLVWWTKDRPEQHKSVNKAELDHIQSGNESTPPPQPGASNPFWQNVRVLLGKPDYIFNMLTFWGSTIMFWGLAAWLPAYLKSVRGFSWMAMGWLSSLPYILGIVAITLYGVISDKLGSRRAPYFALSMTGSAVSIYFGATVHDNLTAALWMAMAMGWTGVNLAATYTIVQKIAPVNLIGTAAGLHGGSAQFVGAFVPAIVGYVIATTGSYMGGLMFMVTAGAIGACFALLMTFRKV